jgi:UDP-galactopyranose mutase
VHDYLIIGAGLFGSVCARELTDLGYKCLVIEKRNHIAGNCYTENDNGIHVHKYGPHIFHTSNETIWNYINRFAQFNNFRYNPRVKYKNKLYSFPINLLTLYQVYGVTTPKEAQQKLDEVKHIIENPTNLEDWALSQVGGELYEIFIKGYTTKQWGTSPKNLPTSIIKRIPIRLNFDENYYFDKYQGIPIGGYTQIFEKLLNNIEVKLDTDYFENKEYFDSIANKIIYTGPIDKFYNYKFGELEYRSLEFKVDKYNILDYQGVAGINYTDIEVPYTRKIEHKHFEPNSNAFKNNYTIVTTEYPQKWTINQEPYYPINDQKNNILYKKYSELAESEEKYIFGGRLANYKYYDMHQVIGEALSFIKKIKIIGVSGSRHFY